MLNLAVFQFRLEYGKVENNLSRVSEALAYVRDHSLVVLPELWQCGLDYENLRRHAEATPALLQELKKVSLQKGLTVVGTYPLFMEGKLYNSALIVSAGKVLNPRHKIKLFPLYREHEYFTPGSENPVFEIDGVRLGVLICFELRFAELSLSLKEAQILVVPALWGEKRKEHLKVLSRARAIENRSFLLLANAWGTAGKEEYAGCSAIYSPWGEMLAFSEKGDALLQVEVQVEEVYRVRELLPL